MEVQASNFKQHTTMSEKENDKRAKCPVCGRFCKQEAVDKYNGLLNERVRVAKELDGVAEELGAVRKSLVEAQNEMVKAKKTAKDYEDLYVDTRGRLDQACADVDKLQEKLAKSGADLVSMQGECLRLSAENERLYNRSLWERILNKRV